MTSHAFAGHRMGILVMDSLFLRDLLRRQSCVNSCLLGVTFQPYYIVNSIGYEESRVTSKPESHGHGHARPIEGRDPCDFRRYVVGHFLCPTR